MQETDSFAVVWDDPADATITWLHDGMHHPDPILPLAQHVNAVNNEVVFSGRTRYVNGYAFSLMGGPPMPSPELFSRGVSVWTDDYVPRLNQFCRGVIERDYDRLTATELVAELDRLFAEMAEHFKLTMVVIMPFMAPTYQVLATADAALVEARRADFERWRDLTPPPFLGAPPPIDDGPGAAFARHFFGTGVQPSSEAHVVTGIGASKGIVTARARVITSLADSDRLEPGDVLVCATTAAPWTPLFAVAGAVVTDTGGVLSHSAICAREYAIPAVVGTQVGTKQIPDGAMVTVDGGKGTVRVES